MEIEVLPVARRNVPKAGAAMISTWTGPLSIAQSAEARASARLKGRRKQ